MSPNSPASNTSDPAAELAFQQHVAWFHDLTGHRFPAVTDVRAMLDHVEARLGSHSPFLQRFKAAASAAGKLP